MLRCTLYHKLRRLPKGSRLSIAENVQTAVSHSDTITMVITMNYIDLSRLVMGHIVKRLDDRMNVETMAERFHYSPSYLHRIFQHVTGMSVTDFIRVKRLDYAANLLLDTDRSILDICLMSGFDTTQTFNRLFRERYNQTPVMFRRSKQRTGGVIPGRLIRRILLPYGERRISHVTTLYCGT